jgi:conjugal transfer pilus assembly protein TraE
MELKKFNQQWGAVRFENFIGRITLPILAVALLVSVYSLSNQTPIITVLPPSMTDAAKIAHNDANEATKKGYGLYVAQMLGNVHPGTVEFLVKTIEDVLHPSIYHDVKESVMDQVNTIEQENLAISFEPRSVDYWEDSKRVVVFGNRITEGRGDTKTTEKVTYEFEVQVSNYLPQMSYVNVYVGSPERKR